MIKVFVFFRDVNKTSLDLFIGDNGILMFPESPLIGDHLALKIDDTNVSFVIQSRLWVKSSVVISEMLLMLTVDEISRD